MSALRKQMEADMVLRGLAERTRKSYLESVAGLAKFHGRSPDRITELECQRYLLHLLQERKLAHSSCNARGERLAVSLPRDAQAPGSRVQIAAPPGSPAPAADSLARGDRGALRAHGEP